MFYRFFIFCSGADFELLNECPSFERGKYASIGATVFFTGLFAFVAASYALSRVFHDGGIPGLIGSIFFGFLWGLLIFNLDRYIVASLKKRGNLTKEFTMAVPRIVIAILISIVIAKPLEVKLFEDRIKHQISQRKKQALKDDEADYRAINGLDKLEARRDSLEIWMKQEPKTEVYRVLKGEKESAEAKWVQAKEKEEPILIRKKTELEQTQSRVNHNYSSRRKVTSQINGLEDFDPNKAKLQQELRRLEGIRSQLIPKRDGLRREIAEMEKSLQTKEKAYQVLSDSLKQERLRYYADLSEQTVRTDTTLKKSEASYAEQTDDSKANIDESFSENFITQIEALGELTDKTKNPTLWWANILISLLFIVIETAPVFVKLLTPRGPYDDKQFARENMIRENIEHDISTQVQINTEKNNKILAEELRTNQVLLEKISQAQLEVANEIVDAWRENEIEKINGERNRSSQEYTI